MKQRNIAKQFDTIYDFGLSDLIVGGCSFTYNNHEQAACTWPYYLRDFGGFNQVYDCSMVGGGNGHTARAVLLAIEQNNFDPKKTLVVVQIAGNDRDDYIVDPAHINDYAFEYRYADNAVIGITGGQNIANFANPEPIVSVHQMKNRSCRSLENFVNLVSLDSYLALNGFSAIFFEYRDYSLPGRDKNFDPREYLLPTLTKRYEKLVSVVPENFYRFCLKNDLLESDDFHPSADGHLIWTRQCLLPYLITRLNQRR